MSETERRRDTTPAEDVDRIAYEVGQRFRTFGGGRSSEWNPIAAALADQPPQFAAGVDVRAVVRFIYSQVRRDQLCDAFVEGACWADDQPDDWTTEDAAAEAGQIYLPLDDPTPPAVPTPEPDHA